MTEAKVQGDTAVALTIISCLSKLEVISNILNLRDDDGNIVSINDYQQVAIGTMIDNMIDTIKGKAAENCKE